MSQCHQCGIELQEYQTYPSVPGHILCDECFDQEQLEAKGRSEQSNQAVLGVIFGSIALVCAFVRLAFAFG